MLILRGEVILWLIGIDEKSGVVDFKDEEISEWIAKYKNEFDNVYPEIKDIIVPYNSQKIVALLIKTDRFPYVIKNPLFGSVGQGPIQYEIPRRENAATRTAKREDIISLLVPIIQTPQIEILGSKLICEKKVNINNQVVFSWFLDLEIYVISTSEQVIVIPFHKCSAKIKSESNELSFRGVALRPPPNYAYSAKGSIYIESSQSELLIKGPGKVKVFADAVSDNSELSDCEEIFVEVDIFSINTISKIKLNNTLSLKKNNLHLDVSSGLSQSEWG